MKNTRQNKIIEIIQNETVETQSALLEKLKSAGFNTTQATLSRDIKDLGLIKTRDEMGVLRYEIPTKKHLVSLKSSILSADSAGNIAVLKCKSGTASAVCAEIDAMHYENVVGTIAGDDTIFILFKDFVQADEFKKRFM